MKWRSSSLKCKPRSQEAQSQHYAQVDRDAIDAPGRVRKQACGDNQCWNAHAEKRHPWAAGHPMADEKRCEVNDAESKKRGSRCNGQNHGDFRPLVRSIMGGVEPSEKNPAKKRRRQRQRNSCRPSSDVAGSKVPQGCGGGIGHRLRFMPFSLFTCPFSLPYPFFNTSINASCGMFTRPKAFIFFLPSFCFSSSLRLRVMSPP